MTDAQRILLETLKEMQTRHNGRLGLDVAASRAVISWIETSIATMNTYEHQNRRLIAACERKERAIEKLEKEFVALDTCTECFKRSHACKCNDEGCGDDERGEG